MARVGAALGHQPEHLALARGELVERRRALAAAEQLGDDLGVERGAAGGDAPQRRRGTRDVGDAVLEQVADALAAAAEQVGGVALLDVLAEDEDRHVGVAARGSRRAARTPSSVWVGGMRTSTMARSGSCSSTAAMQRVGVADRGDDLVAGVGEQRREALAQQDEVLGDHDAHGSSARTRSARPPGCRRPASPSSASTRCASPSRPEPAVRRAPPLPSSATSTTSRPSS